MDAERWKQVDALFQSALDRSSADRDAFLRHACAGDEQLEREVRSLLAAHADADCFLDAPAIDVAARQLAGSLDEDGGGDPDPFPGQSRGAKFAYTDRVMRLTPGTSFGAYEIEGLVGTGGMGEVYRATDTRLRRTVALKVLPAFLVVDENRSARFRREAQLLAALNHPNVASIYDVTESNGAYALILEFVDGETLARRLNRGRLALDDAIALARQIASALDSAHSRGIVHRDLKPANIAITANGQVKLLDFGIAKALEPDDAESGANPTLTAAYTRLGTPSYMSPEQVRGEPVDQRADIWAFGCVVYEMVTGHRAFPGETTSEALSAVLKGTPDWDAVPLRVRPLLQRCLESDPSRRLRNIGDADLWLEGSALPVLERRSSRPFAARWFWTAAALVVVAALVLLALNALHQTRTDVRPFRFEFSPPEGVMLAGPFSVSPDGRRLAFIGRDSDSSTSSLWIHSFESGLSEPFLSVHPAGTPVWSTDGRFIAVMTGRPGAVRLERISLDGGSRQTLLESGSASAGDWNDRDVILFVDNKTVMRIAASGGLPVQVTTLDRTRDEVGHYSPRFLPDGTHFVYLRLSASEGNSGICVGSIDAKPEEQDRRRLVTLRGTVGYARPGYLLFNREGTLFAQRFDDTHLELRGDPIRVAEHVSEAETPARPGAFQFSRAGVLAYRAASTKFGTPYWVDRTGEPIAPAVNSQLADPRRVRISPDGHRLALTIAGDLWLSDLTGAPPMKITTGSSDTLLWTPDGQRVIYETLTGLRSVRTDGAGTPEAVSPAGHYHPDGWSSHGQDLIVTLNTYSAQGWDILRIPAHGAGKPQPILNTRANEGFGGASLSTDGHWLAYTSDSTGVDEIYVRPYPGPGEAVRVSPNGGSDPLFSRDDRELYYWEGTRLMATPIESGTAAFTSKPAKALFDSRKLHLLNAAYDVARDGRFLMIVASDRPPTPSPITLIINWASTLAR
jgi:eukaryotic-like serine/threonine-protein kinase